VSRCDQHFLTIVFQITISISRSNHKITDKRLPAISIEKSLAARMQSTKKKMATISERVTTHYIYLVGVFPVPPISRSVPSGARPPSCPPGTGHTQMGPSILRSHCYSKYPAPLPLRAVRCYNA